MEGIKNQNLGEAYPCENDIHAKSHNLIKSIHNHDSYKALVQVLFLLGQIDLQLLEAIRYLTDVNVFQENLAHHNLLHSYLLYS